MMYIDAADTAAAAAVAVVVSRRWLCFVRAMDVAGCGYRSGVYAQGLLFCQIQSPLLPPITHGSSSS